MIWIVARTFEPRYLAVGHWVCSPTRAQHFPTLAAASYVAKLSSVGFPVLGVHTL